MFLARFFCLLLLACLAACGETPPQAPAAIVAAVNARLDDAAVPHRDPRQYAGLLLPATLAGTPAWIVDYTVIGDGRLCGTGGCPLQVWVGDNGQEGIIFDRQVLEYRLDESTGELSVELNGIFCGRTGAEPCPYRFRWQSPQAGSGPRFRVLPPEGKPAQLAGPIFQTLSVAAPPDSPVAVLLDDFLNACRRAGGIPEAGEALAWLPDLDGDRREELLFDAEQFYCERDGDWLSADCPDDSCRFVLFRNTEQGWQRAWAGRPMRYRIEFGQPLPQLLLTPADCEQQCRERPLQWQAERGQFVLAGDAARRRKSVGR